jgi:hypothetical protein
VLITTGTQATEPSAVLQTAAQLAAEAAAAREAQLRGALSRVSADFQAEVAALEEAAARERRSHQHLLAAARLEAEQRLSAALAASKEVCSLHMPKCTGTIQTSRTLDEHETSMQAHEQAQAQLVAEHEQQAATIAAEHAAVLQTLELQVADQRLAEQAAQAAWAATRLQLERAVSDAVAQLAASEQQAQVQPPVATHSDVGALN